MIKIKTLILLSLVSSALFGQTGYYATDSSIRYNIEIVDFGDKTNSQKVVIDDHGHLVEFNPYEISEYAYADGRVYLSKENTSGDRVFMERLVKGNTCLYYHRHRAIKKFYLEKDSASLIELGKRDENGKVTYKDDLLDFTSDFPGLEENVKLVSYNKQSLTNLILRYNQSNGKPMPFFKFGLCLGSEWMKMIPSGFIHEDPLTAFDYRFEGGFLFGIFIDNPIKVSDLSFHMELSYSSHDFSYQTTEAGKDLSYSANLTSIRIPLHIKYTHPGNTRAKPYASAGAIYLNNLVYEDELISERLGSSITYKDYIYKNNFGCSVACGLDLKITSRNHLFMELRYNRYIGKFHSGFGKLSSSDLSLISGFNF